MEFDFRKLTGLIVSEYGSRKHFAAALGISPSNLSMKLSNKTKWTPEEILKSQQLLHIQPENIATYFFTEKVQ